VQLWDFFFKLKKKAKPILRMDEAALSFLYCLVWVCLAVAWLREEAKEQQVSFIRWLPSLIWGGLSHRLPLWPRTRWRWRSVLL